MIENGVIIMVLRNSINKNAMIVLGLGAPIFFGVLLHTKVG